MNPDVFLHPSPAVLARLGSIAVHVDEMLSPDGHDFDRIALRTLLDDPQVKAFLKAGRELAMLPEMRK